LYDSVELSFIEKLAKAENSHKKDLEDLKTFELLEEAACDSSFCSSSSTVKRLIQVCTKTLLKPAMVSLMIKKNTFKKTRSLRTLHS
jgi:hypothetical protein